jgi:Fe-Mn family superoxide dismutase
MSRLQISRRQLLTVGSLGSATLVMSKVCFAASKAPSHTASPDRKKMLGYLGRSPLALPDLAFKQDALEPVISARTIGFHYGKHHRAYFDNLHKLIDGTPLASQSLEEVVFASHGRPELEAVFNNAAQAWNHNFYWNSLSPTKTTPDDRLGAAIARKFGSIEALSSVLAMTAAAQFGSGWGWLVADHGELAVVKTGNAETPYTRDGQIPLLTVDVWEHAYYLDYQNRRADYLAATIAQHLNWTFASSNFART